MLALTGGEGDRTFIFFAQTESWANSRDQITDFEAGDRLDLSRADADPAVLGDQAFSLIGTEAFTEAGRVRFLQSAARNMTTVLADLDDDVASEMYVVLDGMIDLTVQDLIP